MTEFDKMVRGELYRGDEALDARWFAAKDKAFRYNQLLPSDHEGREALLQELIGKKGKNTNILSPFDVDYGENITIGDNFFANAGLIILDVCPVTIGNNVYIGPYVGLYTAKHPLDTYTRCELRLESGAPITIGDNVWLGGHVCVLPRVTIGSGAVIGAGSVVNRDIPENALAVGNPCRVVRIIDQDQRAAAIAEAK